MRSCDHVGTVPIEYVIGLILYLFFLIIRTEEDIDSLASDATSRNPKTEQIKYSHHTSVFNNLIYHI